MQDSAQGSQISQQKGHASVFFILLIVIALFLAWFIVKPQVEKRQAAPTAVEQTTQVYEDSELKFQFEYPKDFEVVFESEEEYSKRTKTEYRKNFKYYVAYEPPKFIKGLIVKPKSLELTSNQFAQIPLTLWVFENPNKLESEAWYKEFWYYPFVWGIFAEPQKSQIGPKEGSASVSYQPGKPKFILRKEEDKMFLFKIIEDDGKILESLKFL